MEVSLTNHGPVTVDLRFDKTLGQSGLTEVRSIYAAY